MFELSKAQSNSTALNIKIGVFFDGTGLNANNLVCKTPDDEYLYSNIYRLYKYYGSNSNSSDADACLKVYVEGVGTKSNESNSLIVEGLGIDIATYKGWGAFSKYNSGLNLVAQQITDYLKLKTIGNCNLNISFDVFGFSRGAAIARHFTNKVAKNDADLMKKIKSAIEPYACSLGSRPSVNFLGLFDTVASIWTVNDTGIHDPHDTGNTNNLDVNLGLNVAGQVFQLTAMHECRYNFPLSSLEGFYPQLELAGCHSDIGGSYAANNSEMSEISKTYYYEFSHPSVIQKITKYIDSLRKNIKWRQLLKNWKPSLHIDGLYGWGEVTKNVRGDLQYVSLLLMVDCAQKYGCPFEPEVITNYETKISGSLNTYYKSALINMDNVLAGQPSNIPQTLIDSITAEYVHISSTWKLDGDDNLENIERSELPDSNKPQGFIDKIWTMRPDNNWCRKIYLNNQPL